MYEGVIEYKACSEGVSGYDIYRNDLHLICVSVLGYDYLELGLLGLGLLFM